MERTILQSNLAPPSPRASETQPRSLRKMVRNARWAMEKRDRQGKRTHAQQTPPAKNVSTTNNHATLPLIQVVLQRADSTEGDSLPTPFYSGTSKSLHAPHTPTAPNTREQDTWRRGSTGGSVTTSKSTNYNAPTVIKPKSSAQPTPQRRPQRGAADAVVTPPPTAATIRSPPGCLTHHPAHLETKGDGPCSSSSSARVVDASPDVHQGHAHLRQSLSSLNSSLSSVTFTDLSSAGTKPLHADKSVQPLSLEDNDGHGLDHIRVGPANVVNHSRDHGSCGSFISELSIGSHGDANGGGVAISFL